VRGYLCYDEHGIEELGEVHEDDLPALLDRADAALSGNRQFGIGLYRSKQDFFEIRPVGKSEYMLWSDRIVGRRGAGFWGWLAWLLAKAQIDQTVQGRSTALAAASYYMSHTRDAFERKYS